MSNIQRDEIELVFEGRNLPSPCSLAVYLRNDFEEFEQVLRTEQSMTRIHVFLKTLKIPYLFESLQTLRIVMDYKEGGCEYTAERTVPVARVLRTHNHRIDLRFNTVLKVSKSNQPLISITAGNQGLKSAEISFYLNSRFKNISLFVPSIYYAITESGHFPENSNQRQVKSDISSGFDIIWPEYLLSLPSLSSEIDLKRTTIKISFFMKNWIFSDTFLGDVKLNLLDLLENKRSFSILSKEPKEIGVLKVSKVNLKRKPSFLDYVFGGLDLFLVLASDFSNDSAINQLNEASTDAFLSNELILQTIFDFTNEYDSEKKGFFFGFGSKFLSLNENRFLIEENAFERTPTLSAGDNILKIYKEMVKKIEDSAKTPLLTSGVLKSPFSNFRQKIQNKSSNQMSLKKEFNYIELNNCQKYSFSPPKQPGMGEEKKDSLPAEVSEELIVLHPLPIKSAYKSYSSRNLTKAATFNLGRMSTNQEMLHISSSNNFADNLTRSSITAKKAAPPNFLEEMFTEIAESLRLDSKKVRSSKLRYYVLMILVNDSQDVEEIARALDIAKRLSYEFPVFTRFLYNGVNITLEKVKSLNKSVEVSNRNKIRKKSARIISLRSLIKEAERGLSNQMARSSENDGFLLDLRKRALRQEIFRTFPLEVIESFVNDDNLPPFLKFGSFFS